MAEGRRAIRRGAVWGAIVGVLATSPSWAAQPEALTPDPEPDPLAEYRGPLEAPSGERAVKGATLSPTDAAALATDTSAVLRLPKLKALEPDAALELAAWLGDELVLDRVTTLDHDTLQALAQGAFARQESAYLEDPRRMVVRAEALTELGAGPLTRPGAHRLVVHAPALRRIRGPLHGIRLHVPGDRALGPLRGDLAGTEPDLVLEDLATLDAGQRAALATLDRARLSLPAMQTLTLQDAQALPRTLRELRLDGVQDVSVEVLAALPRDLERLSLDGLQTLSPEQAAALPRSADLSLDGLTALDPATAKGLRRQRPGAALSLDGLTLLDYSALRALGHAYASVSVLGITAPTGIAGFGSARVRARGIQVPGHISKQGLELEILDVQTLDAETATTWASSRLRTLRFPDATSMAPGAAATLASMDMDLIALPALRDLSPEDLTRLGSEPSYYKVLTLVIGGMDRVEASHGEALQAGNVNQLVLHGKRTLVAEEVDALRPWADGVIHPLYARGEPACLLALPHVEQLDVHAASALASLPCTLDLGGLVTADGDVAEALARHAGPGLHLRRLPLTAERARILLAHPGLSHPGATRPLPERLAAQLGQLDTDTLTLRAPVHASPEAVAHLAASPADSLTVTLIAPDQDSLDTLSRARRDALDLGVSEWTQQLCPPFEAFSGSNLAIRGTNDLRRSRRPTCVDEAMTRFEGEALYVEHSVQVDFSALQARSLTLGRPALRRANLSTVYRFPGDRLDLSALSIATLSGYQPIERPLEPLFSIGLWGGSHLDLSGLESLPGELAASLAAWPGETLDLSGLQTLDDADLTRLKNARSKVIFPDPMPPVTASPERDRPPGKALSERRAEALLRRARGDVLVVDGVEALTPEAALRLATFGGTELSLPDLRYLDEDAAYNLFGFGGHTVRLDGLTQLPPHFWEAVHAWTFPRVPGRPDPRAEVHLHLQALTEVDEAMWEAGPGVARPNRPIVHIHLRQTGPLPDTRPRTLDRVPRVVLHGITSLATAQLDHPQAGATFVLPDVTDLSSVMGPEWEAAARARSTLRTRALILPGITSLDLPEAQALLALRTSSVHLPNLETVQDGVQADRFRPKSAPPSAQDQRPPSCGDRMAERETLSTADVDRLARCDRMRLDLGGLVQPKPEWIGQLDTTYLGSRTMILGVHGPLRAELARAVTESQLREVELRGITELSAAAARELRDYPGILTLRGPVVLDEETARILSGSTARTLTLPRHPLPPAVAATVPRWAANVRGIDASRISAAMARSLVAEQEGDTLNLAADGRRPTEGACAELAAWSGKILKLGPLDDPVCARALAGTPAEELWLNLSTPGHVAREFQGFQGDRLHYALGASSRPDAILALLDVDVDEVVLWAGWNPQLTTAVAQWSGPRLTVRTNSLDRFPSIGRARAHTLRIQAIDAPALTVNEDRSQGVIADLAEHRGVLELVDAILSPEATATLQAVEGLELRLIRSE